MTHNPLLLDVRGVADLLNLSTASVWRHVAAGLLPRPVKLNGSTRWKLADIEAAVAALGSDA